MAIEVDISTAVAFYVFVSLILLLAGWIFFEARKDRRKYSAEEKYVWKCSICANVYIDSIHSSISRCPQCKSFNKREENGSESGKG
jgi:hypothetical protein